MKIRVVSDLHLEFGAYEIDGTGIDLLILAGDTHLGENGILWALERFRNIPVLYILGNHEYYRNTYPKLIGKLRRLTENTNVCLLEKDSVVFENITFHGATLWTNFELFGNPGIAGYVCQQRMNDYRLITKEPAYSRLISKDTAIIHYSSINWLGESLSKSTSGKNVVITHHAPSIKSIPEKFRTDYISAAYASNLEDFIVKHQPDLWIHGHMHESSDYILGKTRVIANPKGYPDDPNPLFNPHLTIEIE